MRSLVAVLLGMTLAACASDPVVVKPQVLLPPPAAPRTDFYVANAEVQSREVGAEAAERNEAYGRLLAESLRDALRERGRTLTTPPADVVRAKVYLAYGEAPVKAKGQRRGDGQVEVRLQLHDAANGRVVYTTHTATPIPRYSSDDESDAIIRAVLAAAARDFASRL